MNFIDLIYPKRCPVCLDALPLGESLICPDCEKKVRRVQAPTCFSCGKPLSDGSFEFCRNCEKNRPSFKKGLSWAEYTSKYIRRLMAEVKYHGNCQLLDYPCKDFAERNRREILSWGAEALIPVPVHDRRKRIRGYNQAEEIANRLGEALGIPTDPDVLFRVENTRAQKELTREARQENLMKAFYCPPLKKPYDTVILVDDIYTTGSTAESCTRALLSAGIRTVYFLSLAIGHDDRIQL